MTAVMIAEDDKRIMCLMRAVSAFLRLDAPHSKSINPSWKAHKAAATKTFCSTRSACSLAAVDVSLSAVSNTFFVGKTVYVYVVLFSSLI